MGGNTSQVKRLPTGQTISCSDRYGHREIFWWCQRDIIQAGRATEERYSDG